MKIEFVSMVLDGAVIYEMLWTSTRVDVFTRCSSCLE